ncbi:lipocalin family protein [Halomonas sp. RT37]|uniref:Outer membrane lipoprotein Blc n=1 Tax=Halomonas sp. RT37 TaxID=2950872 RepID=A0AAU7KFN5_9GAMM
MDTQGRRPSSAPARKPTRLSTLLAAVGAPLVLSACTGLPSGTQPIDDFALEDYLGRWYEIARFDHSFEEGLDCVTADYATRDDGGIQVINRGVDLSKGEPDVAEGKAYLLEEDNVGRLKVSFFGPFYASYNILALDDAGQWSLVTGPDRDYLWILARSPQLDDATYRSLVQRAQDLDYPVEELIEVEQGEECEPYRQG